MYTHTYIYIYVYIYMYTYICIYIYIERERELSAFLSGVVLQEAFCKYSEFLPGSKLLEVYHAVLSFQAACDQPFGLGRSLLQPGGSMLGHRADPLWGTGSKFGLGMCRAWR